MANSKKIIQNLNWRKLKSFYLILKNNPTLINKALQEFRYIGFTGVMNKIKYKINRESGVSSAAAAFPFSTSYGERSKLGRYEAWREVNKLTKNQINVLLHNLSTASTQPKISLILPVYNPPLELLEKAVASVKNQLYENWELCIVDDCSSDPAVKAYIENLQKEKNIKAFFNLKNLHISLTTNQAVELAGGDYLVFLDQDDLLSVDALSEVVLYLSAHPETGILYSDNDIIDLDERHSDPQFKPDWSPEYLLSFMYFSHLVCVKKTLFDEVGGFRKGFEGSQDFDFALRASERTAHIGHIPKILYHWRSVPGSTAAGGNEKSYSFAAGVRAVQETLDRRGIHGRAYHPDWALRNGNGVYAIEFPDDGPEVGIIIPTRNKVDLLKRCVNSLKATTYKNFSIYIIDNDSNDPKTLEYLKTIKHTVIKISSPNGKFNFSHLNNRAVESVKEELLLFLNNDTEVINPRWLAQMVGYLQMKGVGSVGAKLFFPDQRVQHAGIVHGIMHGFPTPAFKLLPRWEWGYLSAMVSSRNYSAVTAACMLTRKSLFQEAGGFNEIDFSIAFNDCDYGYNLLQRGFRNVVCPEAELFHFEGATREQGDQPCEEAAYIRKYYSWKDPYYNPNLSQNCTDFLIDSKTVVLHPLPRFKLLIVTHNLNYEGSTKVAYELAKQLKQRGNIELTILSQRDGPMKELYFDLGVNVKIFDISPLFHITDKHLMDQEFERLRAMVESLNVDVVFGNTVEAFWCIKAAKMLNKPSIWTIHESEPPFSQFESPSLRELAREGLNYPYKVVFVADATRKVFEPLNTHHNFITIHNGFDGEQMSNKLSTLNRDLVRKQLNIEPESLNLLLLGTVSDRKGQLDLVKAIELLGEDIISKMTFDIVGDRRTLKYSTILHSEIKKLPASKQKRIRVFDETPDVYKHYLSADIFLCTSRLESFPKVIQEAMYFQLPIITTPVFGIIEQVRDNVSALFYSPGDTKYLKHLIELLFSDKELRERLGSNAKISLDIMPTLDEMGSEYEMLFKEAFLSGESR